MRFLIKKSLIIAMAGLLGLMLTACGRYWDLSKIVAKNFAYEIQNPVQPPAAKLKMPLPGNPGNQGIFAGWVGHSTVLINFSGTTLLTDPNFSRRIKILRRAVDIPLEPEELGSIDLVLISHAHYDHFDLQSLKRLSKDALLVIPSGCRELVEGLGFAGIIELGWNERFRFRDLEIEAFKPAHWAKRSWFDDEVRGYNAYLLTKNGKTILFAGDTGYSRIFAEKSKERDFLISLLPITAYKPEWFRRNHLNPEEALRVFQETQSRFMIPIHWGTFILSHEPIEEPIERLKAESLRLGIRERVIILKHGEFFRIPEQVS
jgi:L-ascorbate metabolism protein UlaG (beta-lactamase superfamily)